MATATSTPFPVELHAALRKAGYSPSSMDVETLGQNIVNFTRCFHHYLTNTAKEPMKMINSLVRQNLSLHGEVDRLSEVIAPVGAAYQSQVSRWALLEKWAEEQGIEIPEEIVNHGNQARQRLMNSGIVI